MKAKKTKESPITFFRKANEARQNLVKKSMGGPGSGMGRMAADDAAFDAMMNSNSTPTPKPKPVNLINPFDSLQGKPGDKTKSILKDYKENINSKIIEPKKKGGTVKSKKKR